MADGRLPKEATTAEEVSQLQENPTAQRRLERLVCGFMWSFTVLAALVVALGTQWLVAVVVAIAVVVAGTAAAQEVTRSGAGRHVAHRT